MYACRVLISRFHASFGRFQRGSLQAYGCYWRILWNLDHAQRFHLTYNKQGVEPDPKNGYGSVTVFAETKVSVLFRFRSCLPIESGYRFTPTDEPVLERFKYWKSLVRCGCDTRTNNHVYRHIYPSLYSVGYARRSFKSKFLR